VYLAEHKEIIKYH